VVWVSHSVNTAGEHQDVTITGSRGNRHVFRWDATAAVSAVTGTTVTAHNDEQRSLSALEIEDALASVQSHFAPILLNEAGLTIRFDGTILDPGQEIFHDTRLDISFGEAPHRAQLRIIEWRSRKHRALYF
jgi:hypothetical protein